LDSVFGDTEPQFAVNFGTASQVIVQLDNTIITKDELVVKKIISESDLETDRAFISFGGYWELDIVVNLLAYTNPQAKYNEIVRYNNQSVVLWKHRDELPYQDRAGDNIPFIIDEITPFSLDTFDFSDKLLIKFLQLEAGIYSLTGETIQTENGIDIQTEDGQTIETE
jgi:hypothetical protein